MKSKNKQLLVSSGMALITLIVCAQASNGNETTAQKTIKSKSQPQRKASRFAEKSRNIAHKNAKTPNRRDLQEFLSGKSKTYKGFDSYSTEDF